MQMKQILLIGFLFFFPWLAGAGSYTSLLRQMGMENIREAADPEGVYLCWEDPVYRGPVRGLAEILSGGNIAYSGCSGRLGARYASGYFRKWFAPNTG